VESFVKALKAEAITPHIDSAKVKLRGLALAKVRGFFTFPMITYNLIRMPKLLAAAS
jgi:hypothetical protein